jgi:hypothetical protein
MSEPGVEIMWSALKRAWRNAGGDELWLQFRPRGSKDVFAAVEAAVQTANKSVEDAGWGEHVFGEGVSDSDAGPVALMSRAGPEEGVRAWLDAFATHLQSQGLRGRITAAPFAGFPRWTSELPLQLTAFVSYQTKDLGLLSADQQRRTWHVSQDLTAKVAEAGTLWGRFDGAEVYLSRNIHQTRSTNPDVGTALASGVEKFAMASVTYLRSDPPRYATVALGILGEACYTVADDSVTWRTRLAKLTRAMVRFPDESDLAFVQYTNYLAVDWSDLAAGRPHLPYVKDYHVRYNRHLYTEYVPDAHGIQLLTSAHLARAADLSEWVVEPIAADRFLVQAKDLEPWYAAIEPDVEVLSKARADFGGMLLTPEIIADNPAPWR